jgi:hypothetical protein
MTFFSAIPVPETEVGIALETVRGTPVAPEYWIPIMGPKYKPDVKLLPDEGMRGSMVKIYDEIPSLRVDTHAWDQYPYLDSFPVLVRALVGSKDTRTAIVVATKLIAEAKVTDKKILSTIDVPIGTVFVLDEGIPATEESVVSLKSTKLKALEWEIECAALKFTHVISSNVSIRGTELQKAALVGDTTIKVVADTVVAGGYVVIDTGVGVQETALVTKVVEVGPGEWTLTLGYPLAFGHKIKAVVNTLTSHAFSLLNNSPIEGNQPPSYTITDFAGETIAGPTAVWRQLAAAQLDTLTITGAADALPKVATNWFANSSITPSPPTPSYSIVQAPPGWAVQAAVGGVQVGYLVNWEFALKRGVKNVPAITGTMNYYQHFAYALEATAKFTFLEDPKATWLTAYQNGEQLALDLTLSDVQSGFAVNLHSTKSKFLTGDLDRSKEWVEVHVESQLIPSSTDATAGGVSPLKITVANATPNEY